MTTPKNDNIPEFIQSFLIIEENTPDFEIPTGFSWNAFLWNCFWCFGVGQWQLGIALLLLPVVIAALPGINMLVGLPLEIVIGYFLGRYGHSIAFSRKTRNNANLAMYLRHERKMVMVWFMMAVLLGFLLALVSIMGAFFLAQQFSPFVSRFQHIPFSFPNFPQL